MTITVVSHNAFWMQGHPFEGDQPGGPVEAIVSGLADRYRGVRPDVLCLQEIQSAEAFGAISAAMALPGSYTPGRELRQYGACALSADARILADSGSTPAPFTRAFQLIEAGAAGRGLRIANVHLPSGRQIGAAEGAARRLAELEAILRLDPPPDVLCGDLNERPGGAVSDYLARQGFVDAAAITGNADRCTSIGGTRGDYIWLRRSIADRLRDYGVCPPADFLADVPGKTFLSDHLPLWISVEADESRSVTGSRDGGNR